MTADAARYMLDTNVAHAVASDDDLRNAMRQAETEGRVQLLITHVQVDEILDAPDESDLPPLEPARRRLNALLSTGVRAVETRGFILDVSRLDLARLASNEAAARIEAYRRENPKHSQDALIAETALQEGAALVTGENAKHRNRMRRAFPGLDVLSVAELKDRLRS